MGKVDENKHQKMDALFQSAYDLFLNQGIEKTSISDIAKKAVKQEDIKAKFEDGTLKLFVPKEAAKPAVEQKKYISIEG